MNQLENHPLERESSIPYNSNLGSFVVQCLFSETLYNGETKLEYLKRQGNIPNIDERALQEYIQNLFSHFSVLTSKGEYSKRESSKEAEKVLKEVKQYLLYSGAAIVVTAGDWSVDRMRAAESAHGLRDHGFSLFEQLLEKKYGREHRIHLHKGPGNGALMQELRKEGRLWWEEIGVGDKLYFALEDILHPYIDIDFCRNNTFYGDILNIVFSMIKKGLKEKWFENTGTATISKWEQRISFCDLNDIFEVLRDIIANPQKHFSRIFDEREEKLIISTDFEDDSFQSIPTDQFKFIMESLGYSGEKLHKRIKKHFEEIKRDEREKIYAQIENALNIYTIVKKVTEEFKFSIQKETLDIIFTRANELGIDIPKKLNAPNTQKADWDSWHKRLNEIHISEISIIDSQKFDETLFGGGITIEQFFGKVFTENFYNSIVGNRTYINLNEEISLFPQNFIQGFFLDIPHLLPQLQGKVSLISATRSDSHEIDADFENDIKNNLELLAPGGCLVTDGVRESFSRVFRLPEIRSIFENTEEYSVFLVVSKRRRPKSLLIQRKHPVYGYLTEEELRKIYRTKVDFKHIEKVGPYLEIISEVREKVLALTGRTYDVFKAKHSDIRKKVQDLIEEEGIKKFIDRIGREGIEEYYRDFTFLREKFSPEQREHILSHFEDKKEVRQYLSSISKFTNGEKEIILKLLENSTIHYLLRHKRNNTELVDIVEACNPFKYGIGVKGIIIEEIRFEDSKNNLIGESEKVRILVEMERWIDEFLKPKEE